MLLTLLPYLTVVVNLALVLGILLGLNQRVRELRARAGKQEKALETETARLSAEIAELKGQLQELEQSDHSLAPAAAASGAPATTGSSVSTTLRSRVLKMHRLGQSPDRIAGALRVPQGEVDLLVKVHKIVMRPYEEVVLAPLGVAAAKKP
jgi:transposase-like protein